MIIKKMRQLVARLFKSAVVGLSAMGRVGVVFTNEQKEIIKNLATKGKR